MKYKNRDSLMEVRRSVRSRLGGGGGKKEKPWKKSTNEYLKQEVLNVVGLEINMKRTCQVKKSRYFQKNCSKWRSVVKRVSMLRILE